MQFAIENQFNIVISASELILFEKVFDGVDAKKNANALEEKVTTFDEDSSKFSVAYGSFIPCNSEKVTFEDAIDYIENIQNKMFTYYDAKSDSIRIVGISCDFIKDENDEILYIKSESSKHYTIPLVFLLEIDKNFEFDTGIQSIAAFLKYSNLNTFESLINRKGIFAINAEEKRKKIEVSLDNWRSLVDNERAIRIARKIK